MKKPLPGLFLGVLAAISLWGCAGNDPAEQSEIATDGLAVATFAGGCFWCVEADFEKLPGVVAATSGYTGGHVAAPSYEQVSSGATGHREAGPLREALIERVPPAACLPVPRDGGITGRQAARGTHR